MAVHSDFIFTFWLEGVVRDEFHSVCVRIVNCSSSYGDGGLM